MKQVVLFLILASLTFSCNDVKPEKTVAMTPVKPQTLSPFSNVFFKDKYRDELVLDTLSTSEIANFSPLYMGSLKDSITINYKNADKNHLVNNWGAHKNPLKSMLSIYIDTTKQIGSPIDYNALYQTPSIKPYRALSFPVFIKNQSKDTLNVGFGDYFPMVTEVKDTTGQWIPIEKQFIYMCGTGLPTIILPPNQIAITSVKKSHGRYHTKLRLRYELIHENYMYSNEIDITTDLNNLKH